MNRHAIAILSFTAGALITSMVWTIARMHPFEPLNWDQIIFTLDIFEWRLGKVVQPIFALIAVGLALKGRLRAAAWWMLGYFIFEMVQGVLTTMRYWP